MPIHCPSVVSHHSHHHPGGGGHRGGASDHHHHHHNLQRSRSSPTSITYDISEVKITRCVVKSEGRKEVRVQAFFELRKDPKVKGRKQKSFSISKFGLDGAWARANRCKEFIDQLQRFPVDENEVDAFQGKAAASIVGDRTNPLATPTPGNGMVIASMYNSNKENLSPVVATAGSVSDPLNNNNNEWSPFRAATFNRTASSHRRTATTTTTAAAAGFYDQNFRNSEHNVPLQTTTNARRFIPSGGISTTSANQSCNGGPPSSSSAAAAVAAAVAGGSVSSCSRGTPTTTLVAFSQQQQNASFRRRMSNHLGSHGGNHTGDQPQPPHGRSSYGTYSSTTNTPSAFFPCPPPMSRHPDGKLMGVMAGMPDCLYPTVQDLSMPSIHISPNPLPASYLLAEMNSKSFLYIARFLTARALSSLEKSSRAIRRQVSEESGAWKACFFGTLPHMVGLAAQEESQSPRSTSRNDQNDQQQLRFPFKTASTNLYKAFLAYEFATRNWLLYNEMRQNGSNNNNCPPSTYRKMESDNPANNNNNNNNNNSSLVNQSGCHMIDSTVGLPDGSEERQIQSAQHHHHHHHHHQQQQHARSNQSYSSSESVSSNASSSGGSSARSFGSAFFSHASNSTAATMQQHNQKSSFLPSSSGAIPESISANSMMDDSAFSVAPGLPFRERDFQPSTRTVSRLLGDDDNLKSHLANTGSTTGCCSPYIRINSNSTILQNAPLPPLPQPPNITGAAVLMSTQPTTQSSAAASNEEQNFHLIFERCQQTIKCIHSRIMAKRDMKVRRKNSEAFNFGSPHGSPPGDINSRASGDGAPSGDGTMTDDIDDTHNKAGNPTTGGPVQDSEIVVQGFDGAVQDGGVTSPLKDHGGAVQSRDGMVLDDCGGGVDQISVDQISVDPPPSGGGGSLLFDSSSDNNQLRQTESSASDGRPSMELNRIDGACHDGEEDDDHEFYVMEWFLSKMNSLLTSLNN